MLAAAVIELIKILLNFVLNGTTTAGVGELGNFIMGCALVMPAGFIYKQAKTKKHAIIGMATGIVCMAVASALVNGLLLLPAYGKAFGMPVDTFVEANDFTGKTVIPFCTSSSSGLGQSGELLSEMAGTGDWLEGQRFRSSASQEDVTEWVDSLGLN